MSDEFDRLRRQVLDYVSSALGDLGNFCSSAFAKCESPIEKQLLAAIVCAARFCDETPLIPVIPSEDLTLFDLLAKQDPSDLIIEPQAQLEGWEKGWRVDFLIHAWEFGRISGRAQWRRLIVECDGHPFHERTKEQAARDRSRDREFQMRGYTVLRFTGSEIHNKPLDCAKQIFEWAQAGW